MSPQSRHILSDALELPPTERAELIEKLLSSFEFPSRKRIDTLWAREAEKRLDALERGKVKTIAAQEVFEKINKRTR